MTRMIQVSEDVMESIKRMAEQKQDEKVTVCPYCGEEKGYKFSCCGEVHFVEMSRGAWENGEEIK